MARGTTLGEAITQLRNELFESTNPAFGAQTNEAYAYQIKKHHARLCLVFNWPFLRAVRYVAVAKGQQYFDFPEDLGIERIEEVHYLHGGVWSPVTYGIDPSREYNSFDTLSGEMSDPVLRWGAYNDGDGGSQFEVWPTPSFDGKFYNDEPVNADFVEGKHITGSGVLRFRGFRNGRPLVKDSDRLDLDDTLVVLNAAATITRRTDPQKASIIQSEAKAHLTKLKDANRKTKMVVMGGGAPRPVRRSERIQVVRGN